MGAINVNDTITVDGKKAVVVAVYDNGNTLLVQESAPNPCLGKFHLVTKDKIKEE